MKIWTILAISLITSGVILGCTLPSFATCPLVLSPVGRGGYVIQGTGLEKVGAIDVTVTYDTSTLANPRVSPGSLLNGTMQAVNAAEPGVIRMVAVSVQGVNGSGAIAAISFDPLGGSPGKISLQCSMADVNAATLPEQADTADSGGSSSTASENSASNIGSGESPSQPSPSGSGGQAIWLGGVSLQTGDIATLEGREKESRDKSAPAEPGPEPRQETKPQAHADEAIPPSRAESAPEKQEKPATFAAANRVEKMPVPPQGVLERFRDYRGERTKAAFAALFDRKEGKGFRQEPPIAIADGTTRVKIHLALPVAETAVPKFVLKGARLTSLKTEGDEWLVEALPEKGAYTASLSAILGTTVLDFPLTVAPRVVVDLDKSRNVTEKDFVLYLRRRAAKKPTKATVTSGKQPEYIEDYIFTANYLVAQGKSVPGAKVSVKK